jgi:hypothetical protein
MPDRTGTVRDPAQGDSGSGSGAATCVACEDLSADCTRNIRASFCNRAEAQDCHLAITTSTGDRSHEADDFDSRPIVPVCASGGAFRRGHMAPLRLGRIRCGDFRRGYLAPLRLETAAATKCCGGADASIEAGRVSRTAQGRLLAGSGASSGSSGRRSVHRFDRDGKDIADAALGRDVAGIRGVRFELAPEAHDLVSTERL